MYGASGGVSSSSQTVTKIGAGWRPELALAIERREDLEFVEVVTENFRSPRHIPLPLTRLMNRGVTVVPHGLSLSLGGATRPESWRIARLTRLAKRLGSPFVSEHLGRQRALYPDDYVEFETLRREIPRRLLPRLIRKGTTRAE